MDHLPRRSAIIAMAVVFLVLSALINKAQNMGLDAGIGQVCVSEPSTFVEPSLARIQMRRDNISGGDHLIVLGRPDGLRKLEPLLTWVSA
jgi:hypothetical protein